MTFQIVADEQCPECGENGSPKVEDGGIWYWKCPSPPEICSVGYYVPGSDYIEPKPSPEEMAAMKKRVEEWISTIDIANIKVFTYGEEG